MFKYMITTVDYKTISSIMKDASTNIQHNNIYVKANTIYASNNCFAFKKVYEEIQLESGVYEILKANKEGKFFIELILNKNEDVEYPPIKKLFDEHDRWNQANVFKINIAKDEQVLSEAIITLYIKTQNAFNIQFLKYLTGYSTEWDILGHKKDNSLLLGQNTIKVILLPFKLD